MLSYIYKLTDIRNQKEYVGKHNGKKVDYFSSGIIVNKIVKCHGRNVFTKQILAQGAFNNLLLNELEKHFIQLHNTKSPHGYNLTSGGDGNCGFAQEVLDKISIGNRGKKKHSIEWKRKASERLTKLNKERVFTMEVLKKMRNSHLGKNSGQDHFRYNATTYRFVHINGDIFIGTKYAFTQKYNVNMVRVSALIRGDAQSIANGTWFLNERKGSILKKPQVRTADLIEDYKHLSLKDLSIKYNISSTAIFKRFNKQKQNG